MSRVYVRQSAFTSYSAARLAGNTGVGAVSVTVNAVPFGAIANGIWVVIDAWTVQAEVRKVTSLSGNTIGFDALSFGHSANDPLLWVSEPVFNVSWFGAVGDGATNDSPAIQAAITEVEVNTYAGTVLLPQGQYHCHTALTMTDDNLTLLGQGYVQMNFVGTGNFLTVRGDYCTIENIYMTAAAGSAGYGIYLHDALRCRIKYCRVIGFQYHQLYTEDSWWLLSEHNEYRSAGADAGYAAVYHKVNANNMVHHADRFSTGDNTKGVVIGATTGGIAGAGILFYGCDFSGTYNDAATSTGLEIGYAVNVVVRDCYFEANTAYGINCGVHTTTQPVNVLISGCYFQGTYGTNQIGINVQKCYVLNIEGCYLLGGNIGTQTGIKIAWADQSVYNCSIHENNYVYNYVTNIDDPRGRAENHFDHRVRWLSAIPLDGSLSRVGDIIYNLSAATGMNVGWICTSVGADVKALWSTTTFVADDFVAATGNKIYRCVSPGGGAAANEPSHTSGDVTEADGYTWHFVASSQTKSTWRTFGQALYRSAAGSPSGSVTPYFIGEEWLDTTGNVWYKSYGMANTNWAALN